MRRVLTKHYRDKVFIRQEWSTRTCGSPLWHDEEKMAGTCAACATGWKHPHNYPAGEPQPTECTDRPMDEPIERDPEAVNTNTEGMTR
jgi:hypothetical protein